MPGVKLFLSDACPGVLFFKVGEGRVAGGVGWDKRLEGMRRVMRSCLEVDEGKGEVEWWHGQKKGMKSFFVWKHNTRKRNLDQLQSFPVSVTISS